MKIFVAGASGVIGRLLLPQLIQAGHEVIGMTRKEEQREAIEQLGAKAILADVFDRGQMVEILNEVKPDVVIHQLTSLSQGSSAENARIRIEGTRNLVDAAKQAKVQKSSHRVFLGHMNLARLLRRKKQHWTWMLLCLDILQFTEYWLWRKP